MNDSVFRSRVKSVLNDNSFDRTVTHLKRGTIDTRSLWRVGTGSTNVFKKKTEKNGKRYSVVITVDQSGSMQQYARHDVAFECAQYLAKNLWECGADVAVVGYNANVIVHHSLGDKVDATTNRAMLRRMNYNFHGASSPSGKVAYACNHDYEALATAYGILKGASHGRILIHLSDGMLSCSEECGYDRPAEYDRSEFVRGYISGMTGVSTFGVGIQSDLSSLFANSIVVDDLEQMKSQIASLIQRNIRRG